MTTVRFTVKGEPVSKARARFTGYGAKARAYTPANVSAAEHAVALAFRRAGGRLEPDPEVTFSVEAAFFNGTRQRRDIDNMLKLILDGLNKVAWVDDLQVVRVAASKSYVGKPDARTEVTVSAVGRLDYPSAECDECGATFRTYNSWSKKRHCSSECQRAARKRARLRTCEHCGVTWDPGKPSQAKYCSNNCRNEHGRVSVACSVCGVVFRTVRSWAADRNYCSDPCRRVRDAEMQTARRTRHYPGTCQVCGAGTTRKEYRRCNPCKLAGHSLPTTQEVS